ncbi:MBL fold metallo-hydrolase [Vicingaceae bacterium]|nr:MBL fold metallo-hydrolase [Vicingaceae bacterium]MDB4062200.1 MBL fold metallo-hydrolase [Vicingaceae bacterium]
MKYFNTTVLLFCTTTTLLISACGDTTAHEVVSEKVSTAPITKTTLVVLGTIQDAGSPQIGCKKACCKGLFENPDPDRKVVAIGVVDASTNKTYLFEATPDMCIQMKKLTQLEPNSENEMIDGIFLTHAHIGHYTGLMYLGKEVVDANRTPVYAMPRMKTFLENNGPWSQLVNRENIAIKALKADSAIQLSGELKVIPLLVPHRDEFSETVGYKIQGPNKNALFIPDIDKWEKWERNIVAEIEQVDFAFLDATFFDGVELNNRDISEIPHPFIIESLEQFKGMTSANKKKVIFIHFNHTNPVIDSTSSAYKTVINKGFRIAQMNEQFEL